MPAFESLLIFLIFIAYFIFLFVWAQQDFKILTSGIEHFQYESPRKDLWIKILDHKPFNILGWITGLFFVGILTCSISWVEGPMALVYIILATALGALALGNAFPTLMRKRKARRAEKEGLRLMREGEPHEVEALLEGLAARKEKIFMVLAADLMRIWGSFRSMVGLFEFNRKSEVESLANAYKTGNRIQRAVFNTRHIRWNGLRVLVGNWAYWKRLQLAAEGKDHQSFLTELATQKKIPADLKDFFLTQQKLHEDLPNVYCERDHQRAVIKEIHECNFIRCPHCFSIDHLTYPVTQVLGIIGGEADGKLLDGTIRIPFWDIDGKKVSKAQVDEIRVFDIPNIDWALAATVERLENEHPLPKPNIVLSTEMVLSKNTQEIIENYNEKT